MSTRRETELLSDEADDRDYAPKEGCILRVVEGDDQGKELAVFSGKVIVGKHADCDLRLTDTTVSRSHLSVELTDEGIVVTDLQSTNGTYYLDTKLEKATLPLGAVLTLGHTRLMLASQQLTTEQEYSDKTSYGRLVGVSLPMRALYAALERLEQFDYTVLITGETGVGKELVAHEIHRNSQRKNAPFEVCDCTSLTPNLAENELFGHVRGSYTGAEGYYAGVFERADGGTVFLDEVGELPLELQPKLLRVLESSQFRPIGGDALKEVDVRVVAATNRDLYEESKTGRFRKDLFYRLNMVSVRVPALRERREDIPALLKTILAEHGQGDLELSPMTMKLLITGYDWPGNVRELRNALARMQAMGQWPGSLSRGSNAKTIETGGSPDFDLEGTFQGEKKRIVEAFERDYLSAKLARAKGNISLAAREAGLERNHFKRLLRKHGLLTGN